MKASNEGEGCRHGRRRADALNGAPHEQRKRCWRCGGGQGSSGKEQQSDHHEPTPSVQVPQPATQQQQAAKAHGKGGQNPLAIKGRKTPVRLDSRKRDSDGQAVHPDQKAGRTDHDKAQAWPKACV
jgi:hypothetical protein